METIKLFGDIDNYGWCRSNLEYSLSQLKDDEPVELQVSSLGGSVTEAIAISQMLRERGNVTAHLVGFCASAATWLVYGCDKVMVNNDCALLIHQAATAVDVAGLMNADELDDLINDLKSQKKSNEALDLLIAQKYANHSNGKTDTAQALKLMRENRWMLPDEALELGIVDEVVEPDRKSRANMPRNIYMVNKVEGLPPLPDKFTTEAPKNTLAQTVKNVLTDFFGGSVARLAPVEDAAPAPVHEEVAETVNKDFTVINGLLEVEGLRAKESDIIIGAEQMTTISNRLTQLASDLEMVTAERNALQNELDDTVKHINSISPEVEGTEGIEAKAEAIKAALNKAAGTATHALLEGDHHNDFATDPVNDAVRVYKRK